MVPQSSGSKHGEKASARGSILSTGNPTRQGNHFCMNAETESLGLGEVWLLESCVSGNKETKEIGNSLQFFPLWGFNVF